MSNKDKSRNVKVSVNQQVSIDIKSNAVEELNKIRASVVEVPLTAAALQGDLALVESMLNQGEDVNAHDNQHTTALFKACRKGHLAVCKLLLSRGANLHQCNQFGASPLSVAVHYDQFEVIKLLIEQGANINTLHGGISIFQKAYIMCSLKTIELLIQHGAIDIENSENRTVLEFNQGGKKRIDHDDRALTYIENGGDVNIETSNGSNALINLCSVSNSYNVDKIHKIIEVLIKKGVNLNSQDKNGYSAVMRCVWNNRGENRRVLQLLLQSGANPFLKTSTGLTALDLAKKLKDKKSIELLSFYEQESRAKNNLGLH